jgi:hypothetical protein
MNVPATCSGDMGRPPLNTWSRGFVQVRLGEPAVLLASM